MKKNIPNLFTLCNLLCGCIAIVFTLEGNLVWCAYMVGFACVFDFLDGMAARVLKVSSELGKQLDSLADIVSFGVVPGVLLYKMIICTQMLVSYDANPLDFLSEQMGQGAHINFLAMIGFAVTIFSAVRLAKFNLDTRQTDSFIGLPTPASAIQIASLPLSIPESLTNMLHTGKMTFEQISAFGLAISGKNNIYQLLLQPYSVIALTVVTSFLLVAPLPLFALKFKNISWTDNKVRYIFLALALVLLIVFKFLGIQLIIILYIVSSIKKKKQNKICRVMKFKAEINVMPLKALLDPQGKAVTGSMKNIGLSEINNVRIGKHISLEIEASNKEAAQKKTEEACKKLLANPIMEFFEITLEESK